MPDFDSLKGQLFKLLPKERYEHSLRVVEQAEKLAERYHVPKDKARLSALLHDCARHLDGAGMLKLARELGFKIEPIEELEPKLLHARLSAEIAKTKFGVDDKEVLQAISRHTVGSPKMSELDKVIYLADHIEVGRDFAGAEEIRKLAEVSLDHAMVKSTGNMIRHLIECNLPVFEGTVQTRNWFLLKK